MPGSARAKRFDKSLSSRPVRRRPIVKKPQWTLAEVTALREMHAAGASALAIAAKLGRSKSGVYAVAEVRGLSFGGAGIPEEAAILGEPAVDPPVRDFATLIGAARYEDDPRSVKPQPGRVQRPATYVASRGL